MTTTFLNVGFFPPRFFGTDSGKAMVFTPGLRGGGLNSLFTLISSSDNTLESSADTTSDNRSDSSFSTRTSWITGMVGGGRLDIGGGIVGIMDGNPPSKELMSKPGPRNSGL